MEKQTVRHNPEKTWTIFCHLGGFAGYVIPLTSIVVPLVLWLMKKEEFPLVNDQGKEAINFNISMTIYALIAGLLSLIGIGIPILIGLLIVHIIFIIKAVLSVNNGKPYHYPLTIRFVS